MLQPTKFYYPKTNLPYGTQEQLYSLRANSDELIAKLFFPHDPDRLSRVLWAHPDYNFLRRREMLSDASQSNSLDSLQLPFASYYRDDAWEYDDRAAGRQVTSQIHKIRWGQDNTGVEGQAIQAMRTFTGGVVFATERDASIALDNIFWWSNKPVWGEYFIYASDTKVHIPATYFLESASLVPEQNMSSWMQQQKMSVVSFAFKVYTPLLRLPDASTPVYMTEKVIHYFHNRNFDVPDEVLPTDWEGWLEIADEVFELDEDTAGAPAPVDNAASLTNIQLDVQGTEAIFTWDYDGATFPSLITFYLHRGSTIDKHELAIDPNNPQTSFTIGGLESQSLYDAVMKVEYPGRGIFKYHYQIQTEIFPEQRKGLHGLKGMTL